ncbi:MAG: DUF1614 domain-containing protein, partial [Clostridia bacterium]
RMHLSDRTALVVIAAIFFGGLIPGIRIGRVTLGIGGALVPICVCVWVLARAGTGKEVLRALVVSVLTALSVFWLGRLLPSEPEQLWVDPNYLYGIAAGLIAYLLGRSRRSAFVGAVFGVLLADVAVAVINWRNGIAQQLTLGTAGLLDAVVISGLLAVLLTELIGEAIERMQRGRVPANDDGATGNGRREK